jgi:hypothetical protein
MRTSSTQGLCDADATGLATLDLAARKGPETLGALVRHLRNAVAHGRIKYSSDGRDPNGVVIEGRMPNARLPP